MDLKEESQGKINEFFDRDFFIPPLIEHTNSSFANLEKFVTLVETIKWNPLTWNFFTDLSHILKVGLSIGVGLLITFIMGILVYFSVKLTIYCCLKYKTYKAKHILNRFEREMELPFIQPRVDPEVINPNLMPLNINETPVFASTFRGLFAFGRGFATLFLFRAWFAVARLTTFVLGTGTRAPRGTRTRRTFGPRAPRSTGAGFSLRAPRGTRVTPLGYAIIRTMPGPVSV